MIKIRYFFLKAKLSGLYKSFFVGVLIFVVGWSIASYASSNITPASVHVSGYYRSSGQYVHSYSRRPPGSRKHDAPYESWQFLGTLIAFGGVFFSGSMLFSILATPGIDFLPQLPEAVNLRKHEWELRSRRVKDPRVRAAYEKEKASYQNLRQEQFIRAYGFAPSAVNETIR